jgi:hypothetical protein
MNSKKTAKQRKNKVVRGMERHSRPCWQERQNLAAVLHLHSIFFIVVLVKSLENDDPSFATY